MININRQIKKLNFFLSKPLQINDITLKEGLNVINFLNDKYEVYDAEGIKDMKNPYAYLYIDEMPLIMFSLFKYQTYYDVDEKPTVPKHQHKLN